MALSSLWLPERLCWAPLHPWEPPLQAVCRRRRLLGAQAFPRPWPVAWPCQDPCHLPGAGVRCVLTLVLVSAAAPRFRAQAGLSLERRTLDVCRSRASVTLNLVRFLIREMFFTLSIREMAACLTWARAPGVWEDCIRRRGVLRGAGPPGPLCVAARPALCPLGGVGVPAAHVEKSRACAGGTGSVTLNSPGDGVSL